MNLLAIYMYDPVLTNTLASIRPALALKFPSVRQSWESTRGCSPVRPDAIFCLQSAILRYGSEQASFFPCSGGSKNTVASCGVTILEPETAP